MRRKIIYMVAAFCLIGQVGCTSHHSWHTVAPETLEELTADTETSQQDVLQQARIHPVDCGEEKARATVWGAKREDSCRGATITAEDYIRLYAPNRKPVTLRAFSFLIDDGQILEVQQQNHRVTTRNVISLDDLAAIQIREVNPDQTIGSLPSYLFGFTTPVVAIMIIAMFSAG